MTYEEFQRSINNLKDFIKELEKLNDVLKVLTPTGTCVCEIGHKFIGDYISIVETTLGDSGNLLSWFIFENEFGAKDLSIGIEGLGNYIISNEKDFYEVFKKIYETERN